MDPEFAIGFLCGAFVASALCSIAVLLALPNLIKRDLRNRQY